MSVQTSSHHNHTSFFGRIKGRTVSSTMQSLVETHLGKYAIDKKKFANKTIDLPILNAFFDTGDTTSSVEHHERQFVLELGFGSGDYMCHLCKTHPLVHIIGCEIYFNGLGKTLKQIVDNDYKRIRIFHGNMHTILPYLPFNTFEKIAILFPDPWEKKRYHKRRLINRYSFLSLCNLLKKGGHILYASDSLDYVKWVLREYYSFQRCHNSALSLDISCYSEWTTPPNLWISTKYEEKALKQGKKPIYMRFYKK